MAMTSIPPWEPICVLVVVEFFCCLGFLFCFFARRGEGKQACKIACECPKQHDTASEWHIQKIIRSYH